MKKEFLRMLVRLELDPARMHLIAGFFDTYLELNEQEKEALQREVRMLDPKEGKKIMELQTQWERDAELRGRMAGKIEGRIEGEIEEARKFIHKFMRAQFGEESTGMLEKINELTDLDLLERLADRLFRVSRPEEAQRLVQEACDEHEAGGKASDKRQHS